MIRTIKIFLGFMMILFSGLSFGQVKEFYTAQEVKTDSASSLFYAVGRKEPFYYSDLRYEKFVDSVRTYYTKGGSLRSREFYSKEGAREGGYIEYHENGAVKQRGLYKAHYKNGIATEYYESGKKHFEIEYYGDPKENIFGYPKYRIVNYWNELGEQIVNSGNGKCRCSFSPSLVEAGKVSNGLKDSVWLAYGGTLLLFKEVYAKGELADGESYFEGGKYQYKQLLEQPEFKGGYEGMIKFIRGRMVYPKKARKSGVAGTVYVTFVVSKSGQVEDVSILQGVDPLLDEEALRVVRLMSGYWMPGKERGRPVYVRYNLPLKFKLT